MTEQKAVTFSGSSHIRKKLFELHILSEGIQVKRVVEFLSEG